MRRALIAFAIFTGYYMGILVNRYDAAHIPGMTAAPVPGQEIDPLACITWIVVSWVLIKLVRAVTK